MEHAVNDIKIPQATARSELSLLFLSPGTLFVLLYVLVVACVKDSVPLNIRPDPGEFLENGEFVKDSSVDSPHLSSETVSWDLLCWFCFGLPVVIVAAVSIALAWIIILYYRMIL